MYINSFAIHRTPETYSKYLPENYFHALNILKMPFENLPAPPAPAAPYVRHIIYIGKKERTHVRIEIWYELLIRKDKKF